VGFSQKIPLLIIYDRCMHACKQHACKQHACKHATSLHACELLACMQAACMHARSLHACKHLACMHASCLHSSVDPQMKLTSLSISNAKTQTLVTRSNLIRISSVLKFFSFCFGTPQRWPGWIDVRLTLSSLLRIMFNSIEL
jgi:hypothetical protein